ncbi:MAG: branched-chain amino acid ABC transporter permease [bacterium]|jgi:branched-chain amino acid transport system permease protein|nr:branched-chain amino acid ABC transporter permease [Candidatus Aquidulcis sp.]
MVTSSATTGTAQRLAAGLRLPIGIVAFLALSLAVLGIDQFVNALTLGAIYALVALGYTMVYGIIELINFAHGDVFMVGSFIALFISSSLLGNDGSITDLPLLAGSVLILFALTIGIMALVGALIERLAYRPLRRAPKLAPLITAIGVSFILQNIIQFFFGPTIVSVPQLVPIEWSIQVAGARVPLLNLFVIATSVLLMFALQLFISRTRTGRAMRTTSMDRDASSLMGVDINRTIMITFLIGSGLAGAAGVVHGLYYGNTTFSLGFQSGLKAFTAAVLGGIGNTAGAALGGFLIAFVEVGASAFGYGRWGGAIVFSLLVIFLVFRPTGLLGSHTGDRA